MRLFLLNLLLLTSVICYAQKGQNHVIKSAGTIYEIPEAVEKPDPAIDYRIVVDLQTADGSNASIAYSLNNLARMINLHAIGGVSKLEVVAVIHSSSTRSILTDKAYKKRYGVPNPNTKLIRELEVKGILFVGK